MRKACHALIVLETGDHFLCRCSQVFNAVYGELCFTTAMTGYQEVISDPSYAQQIVVFSFPHIGNVGTNFFDNESVKPALAGVVLGEGITTPSNYISEQGFDDWLRKNNVPFVYGVDTRSLVKVIAGSKTPVRGNIITQPEEFKEPDIVACKREFIHFPPLSGQFLSHPAHKEGVIGLETAESSSGRDTTSRPHIALIDCGIKNGIIQSLKNLDVSLTCFSLEGAKGCLDCQEFDGFVVSNGPGDPMAVPDNYLEAVIRMLDSKKPLLGICMGYQLIARAVGGKLKQQSCGHHGINHPVKDLHSGHIMITSQNHEFVLDENELPAEITITHRSLFDNTPEGFKLNNYNAVAYQFHPEASPGPLDGLPLIEHFVEEVKKNA